MCCLNQERRLLKPLRLANIVLGGSGIACILALVHFLYHYAWTNQRHFAGEAGPIVYYFFPALLAVLLIGTLRSSPALKIKVAFGWVLTCVTIYSIEIVLAFKNSTLFPREPTIWREKAKQDFKKLALVALRSGVAFDNRSTLEVIADFRKKGVRAVPAIHPLYLSKQQEDGTSESVIALNGTKMLPLAGIRNTVTVLCNEGQHIIYESDKYGFHNPKGLWDSARVDIAALGDSHTHGVCVSSDRNFVALIRKRYPATLNLGISGQGPLLTLATLKEYGRHIRPKKVLWFFFEGNDFADLRHERNFPLLMRYLERNFSQELLRLSPDIDRVLEGYVDQSKTEINFKALPAVLRSLLKLGNLRQRLPGLNHDSSSHSSVSPEEIELLGKILAEAKFMVESWKGTLYFVYLPERGRYLDGRRANKDEKDRQRVLGKARSAGLTLIDDVYHAFKAQTDPLDLFSLRELRHYNEKGHRLIAKTVLNSVSRSH